MILLYDSSDLLRIIKQAAIDAVEASNPVKIKQGEVIATHPLKVKVGQKMTLSNGQLVKCKDIGNIESGDIVILLQQQGGQEYVILGVKE